MSTSPHRLAHVSLELITNLIVLCRYSKVGLLRKLLAETSRERAEWIIWIDADTIIQASAEPILMNKANWSTCVTLRQETCGASAAAVDVWPTSV